MSLIRVSCDFSIVDLMGHSSLSASTVLCPEAFEHSLSCKEVTEADCDPEVFLGRKPLIGIFLPSYDLIFIRCVNIQTLYLCCK